MIKVETIGMLDVSKNNPILKSESDVKNYSFIKDNDILYLVSNVVTGDDAYKDDYTIKAGEYLNGYVVKAWEGQKLVVDAKHITGGVDALVAGTSILVVDEATGKLKTGSATGVHFVVTDTDLKLTEKAVKVMVAVA